MTIATKKQELRAGHKRAHSETALKISLAASNGLRAVLLAGEFQQDTEL